MRQTLRLLPDAKITEITSEAEFFDLDDVDGLLTTAEGGSAWTLANPEYGVVLPVTPPPKIPLVFLVAGKDLDLVRYLNIWLDFQHTEGIIATYFGYWIQGGGLEPEEVRWNIAHDVLGLW